MWKDSSKGLVINLKAAAFEQISTAVSNKVSDLLECEPIESLIKHSGEDTVNLYLQHELIKLAANINVNQALNLKNDQVPVIASHLMENYKWESIEDFTLCFRRASMGLYGEIFRVDGAVIGQWFSRYLDEKYDALEQKKKKEKEKPDDWKPLVKKYTPGFGKSVMQKYLEDLGVPPKDDNSKENEYQRFKMTMPNKQPTAEDKRMVDLRIQYARECTELQTGRLKPGMPSFEDWLKDKL